MSKKPDIVLLSCDELRIDVLSCYGSRVIETPNIDRLSESSYIFKKAYTPSPWCLPAPCSILTGLLPHKNGAYSNFRDCRPNCENPNLYNILKKEGYKTAHIGKCHYAPVPYKDTSPDKTLPYDDFRDYYLSLGIDHLDLQDDKQVSVWFYDDYSKELDQAGYLEEYRKQVWSKENNKVFTFPGPEEWHPDSWVGRKSVDFIKSYDKKEPLFMWVSFSGPHFTFDPPEEYLQLVDMEELNKKKRIIKENNNYDTTDNIFSNVKDNYSDEYWTKLRHYYYANVVQIDKYIGKILDTIENKFGDDVLIIFTADHGEMLGNHGFWGKNNAFYEDVINIPLLVKYPGQTEGKETDVKVMSSDIMATCMKVAGIKGIETDGVDFSESIKANGYEYICSEGEGFITISDGKMKYIQVDKDINGVHKDCSELYDLERDPDELLNLINDARYSEDRFRLQQQLIKCFMDDLLA